MQQSNVGSSVCLQLIYRFSFGMGTMGWPKHDTKKHDIGPAQPDPCLSCPCLTRLVRSTVLGPRLRLVRLARARHEFWVGTMRSDLYPLSDLMPLAASHGGHAIPPYAPHHITPHRFDSIPYLIFFFQKIRFGKRSG